LLLVWRRNTNNPHKTYTPNGGEGEQVSQV
jgi:hypothetical protein